MNVKGRPQHQQHEETSQKHAVWEEKMIDAFQNGMWSSVFKYDYIYLMVAEGDLSVDLKEKTAS